MTFDFHGDDDRLRDDLAAYALDALEPDEAREVELHLDGCETCRERLQWLRPAVDALPASVPQLAPPASLRANLLETVRAEAPPAAEPSAEAARVSWWETVRAALLRPAVGMAVMIVLVAGVAAGYLLRGSGDEPSSTFISAQGLGPQAAQVSATLERADGSATLHVSEMPELGRDEVYEVWAERAGTLEPRGTFVPGMDGSAEVAVSGSLDGVDRVLVTAEPRPGSPQPTTEPLLEAALG